MNYPRDTLLSMIGKENKDKNPPEREKVDQVVLSERYPLSQLFPFKKSFVWIAFVMFTLSLFIFGGDNFHAVVNNILGALGRDKPILYPILCLVLLASVVYWYAFTFTFVYGIKEGSIYITKGVFMKNTYDYPITSLVNTAVKRDALDMIFGLCTIKLMSAHEASDDIAAVPGLPYKQGVELHNKLRTLLDDYQASRYDIKDLQKQVQMVVNG